MFWSVVVVVSRIVWWIFDKGERDLCLVSDRSRLFWGVYGSFG